MKPSIALELQGITKRFGATLANDSVDLQVKSGTVHALLGENGAGKSTLMSMLCGLYRPDMGSISIHGETVSLKSPMDAIRRGIGMVHQNFRLVPTFTATQNVMLGHANSPLWQGRRFLASKARELQEFSRKFHLEFPAERPIWQLSVGEQQRVEIIKTLYRGADVIILDEPTSVLTPGEVDDLLITLRQMATEGKTVILTTHKLHEVMRAADEISVMRKGQMLNTVQTSDTSERELVNLMVGRDVVLNIEKDAPSLGEPIVEVKNLSAVDDNGRASLKEISFSLREGEIVGVAGVAGNGQKDLAEILTGLRPWTDGRVTLLGEDLKQSSVQAFIERGVSHVPEDRMRTGLAGALTATDNLILKSYRGSTRSKMGILRHRANKRWAKALVDKFNVKTPSVDTPVRQLSGGNQQKLLFAREIDQNPKFMVAMHPTQGLDVAATEDVYRLLLELRRQGSAILLISEDLDEIFRITDKILVLSEGMIRGNFLTHEAKREELGVLMAGSDVEGEVAG